MITMFKKAKKKEDLVRALDEAIEKRLPLEEIRPIAERYYKQVCSSNGTGNRANEDSDIFNMLHQKYQEYRQRVADYH